MLPFHLNTQLNIWGCHTIKLQLENKKCHPKNKLIRNGYLVKVKENFLDTVMVTYLAMKENMIYYLEYGLVLREYLFGETQI